MEEATCTYEQDQEFLAEVALSPEESRSVFVLWADRYDRLWEDCCARGSEVA
jgi:hypothetical protein